MADARTIPPGVHLLDDKTAQAIRARILELYDLYGSAAFSLPSVRRAINFLCHTPASDAATAALRQHVNRLRAERNNRTV
jgi:hypothetical protein